MLMNYEHKIVFEIKSRSGIQAHSKIHWLVVMVHTFNLNTLEVKEGGSLSLKLAWPV